jgi:uncharacterized protein
MPVKILLFSDTHGYFDPKLRRHIGEADEVWHAGDIGDIAICREIANIKPFRAVYGNIDGREISTVYPEIQSFTCAGLDVLMIHIGGSPGKYPAKARSFILSNKPALYVCGHSHVLKVQFDKQFQMLYMNPGAAGMQGFHTVRTALRFEISEGSVKNLAVIELGKRGAV